MTALSNRAAGKLAGCSHVAIAKAIERGHLATLPDGGIDPSELERWRDNRRPERGNQPPVTIAVTAPPAIRRLAAVLEGTETAEQALDALMAEMDADGIYVDRKTADRVAASFAAHMKRLEFNRESGKVVEVEHVAKIVGDALARVRTRLLSIPAEHAPRLHRVKTLGELQDMLLECITEALEELAGDAGYAA